MKPINKAFAALGSVLFFCLPTTLAYRAPERPALPDLDRRSPPHAASPAGRAAALARLRGVAPGARVDFDERLGAPRRVVARDGFLSGPGGKGRGVSADALTGLAADDPHRAAKAFLKDHRALFGHGPEALDRAKLRKDYVTPHNGLRTAVWEQEVDGIPVFEGVFIAHTTKRGELVSLSSQFVAEPEKAADKGVPDRKKVQTAPPISARRAVTLAAASVGETVAEEQVAPVVTAVDARPLTPALSPDGGAGERAAAAQQSQRFQAAGLKGESETRLVWLPMNAEELRLCWDVILTSGSRGEMFRLLVDAQTGEVWVRRLLTRYLSPATYRVFTSDSPSPFSPGHFTPSTNQPPTVPRALVTLAALNTNASPLGWIPDGANETCGNNVDVHLDRNGDDLPDLPRPRGAPDRVFDFPLDLARPPQLSGAAGVAQAFYVCNWLHDRLWELGFTEAAGNFQDDNFGRGGLGHDAVLVDVQDGSGDNNANISVPPDGAAPRIQMYLWSGPEPDRDGAFDAEVLIHEYVHGLSERLVGGGVGLSALQAWGLGEGWSDWYALTLLSEPGDDPGGCYPSGGYVTYLLDGFTLNYYFGIRRYPYSTNLARNPLTFKDIDPTQASAHADVPRNPLIGNEAAEVHSMGEVWCVTLWEARANLIAKHGFAAGNQLALQLVTDGLKLAPPNPNFVEARDAILLADQVLTDGANRKELWAAFAKRGLGVSATSPASSTSTGVEEAFDVPDDLLITPPVGFVAVGRTGGPLLPASLSFALTNDGAEEIHWTAAVSVPWLDVSPTSGKLLIGGPGATVVVSLNTAASSLAAGLHNAIVWFTNQTSGRVHTRRFVAQVDQPEFSDDFEPGFDRMQWSRLSEAAEANGVGGSVSASNSLWFGGEGLRQAVTRPLNTIGGGVLEFFLRLADGLEAPWERPELPAEGIVLECSTDGGRQWTTLAACTTPEYRHWRLTEVELPAWAQTAYTLFRWRQPAHSGECCDQWALDDVALVTGPRPPRLAVQPVSQTVALHSRAVFNALAVGSQPLGYQWRKDGVDLPGATSPNFTVASAQFGDAGAYSVRVTNEFGVAFSSNAVLTVVDLGRNFFDDFDPDLDRPQWMEFGGLVLATNFGGSVSVPNSLWFGGEGPRFAVTRPLDVSCGGTIEFFLRFGDNDGWPWEGINFPAEAIVLEFSTDGGASWTEVDRYDTYQYGWQFRTLDIPTGAQTAHTLFRWRQLAHSGDCCDHWALDDVMVAVAPHILRQPVSLTVPAGRAASFSVAATGAGPLSYQWQKDGVDLPGATGTNLTLAHAQAGDAGRYAVRVANPAGVTLSSHAVLRVVDSNAFVVAVFSDPAYYADAEACLAHVRAALEHMGFVVVPFTDFAEEALRYSTLLVPAMDYGDLSTDLIVETRAALSNHVAQGGSLIVLGSGTGYQSRLLNVVFGFAMQEYWPDEFAPIYWRTAQAADTEFADDAVSLLPNATTVPLQTPTLPWDARSVYENRQQTAVALIEWGRGFIVYLGWDLDGAVPIGSQDGGWLNVLASAVLQKNPLPPRPPAIAVQPQSRTVASGLDVAFSVGAYGSWPLAYQWRVNGAAVPGATNAALALPGAGTNQTGLYDVVVTNPHGAITSAVAALSVVELPSSLEFQIVTLGTNGSRVVDCAPWTGDDRGGLAASTTHVFCTGDESTARFALEDLSGGAALGEVFDALVGDLRSGKVYSLAHGHTPLGWHGIATTLLEHDGATGLTNGAIIPLSQSIPFNVSTEVGLFAGYGCLVVFNGETVYAILLPSGQVVELGPMAPPRHMFSESWAYWGVAEFSGGKVWLVYVRDPQTIMRTAVPDGVTTTVATFDELADMASFTVSVPQGRWYFHYQGPGQFGGAEETLGCAEATFNVGHTNPPVILVPPAGRDAVSGDTVTFSVIHDGSAPFSYQWQKDGVDLAGATNASLTLVSVQANDAGRYRARVSNAFGAAVSSDAALTVTPADQAVAVFRDPAYVGTGGSPWFGAESVPVSLRSQGFAVTTFTNLDVAATRYRRLVIPALEQRDLAMDLPLATRLAVSNFVAQGGALIVHGNRLAGPASRLLNAVFGWSLQETGSHHGSYARTSEALGTEFEDDPPSLMQWPATSVLLTPSLPAEARSLYEMLGESAVALMGVGCGTVVFLGWDWTFAAPLGDLDGGWLDVLASAAAQTGALPPLSPVIAAHPQSRTNVAGVSVTLRVAARGTIPLRYQWQRDGTDIPGATNATFTLVNAQPGDTAAYRVRVANDAGSVFSQAARLEIRPLSAVVAVFDSPRYVATGGGRYDESDTVQASLRSLGFLTATFTNIEAAAGTYHRLLFPCMRLRNLAEDLPPAARASLSNFVAQGGVLIILGSPFEYPANLLNAVFGLAVRRDVDSRPSFTRTLQTTGTEFLEAPSPLLQNYYTMALVTDSLPPHARSLFENGDQTAVALIEWGRGAILFLGWSWTDAVPVGYSDGGWLDVLASAARQEGNLPPQPPLMDLQPQSQTVAAGTHVRLRARAVGSWPLHYQWRFNGTDLAEATNAVLTLPVVAANQSGAYCVVVTNAYGAVTSAVVALTVFEVPATEEFQILSLTADNSFVVDHEALTGEGSGGIAASTLQVFYTGDQATARFSLADLSDGAALAARYDAMVGDLRSGTVYSLANGATPLDSSGGTATCLLVHDARTGLLTGESIPLSSPIRLRGASQVGLFAGYGRIVVHDGVRVYDILVPSGLVVDRGPMAPPTHARTETWAYWGVAEYAGGRLSLVYVRDSQTIARSQVPTGETTMLALFKNLSDMAAFTVSVPLGRWYFHYEGRGQFGGTDETLGFADARFLVGSTNPPLILTHPHNQTVVAGRTATFSVVAAGSAPLAYQWRCNGSDLAGATNATLVLSGVTSAQAGTYSVLVSNALGSAASAAATLTVLAAGAGAVAVYGAPGEGPWNEDVRAKLKASAFFDRVDAFLVSTDYPVPTLDELLQYDAVLVYSKSRFSDGAALGDVLADYLDLDGGVVLAAFAYSEGKQWGIEGRIKRDGYLPFSTGSHTGYRPQAMVVDEPLHPILDGVVAFHGGRASYHNTFLMTNPGTRLLAHWEDGEPLVGVKEIGPSRIVGLNFYPPSSDAQSDLWQSSTDGGRLMANALLWAAMSPACQPRIVLQPAHQTQVPGGTATFRVLARGTPPLNYQWWWNGYPGPGATNATFTVPHVQPADTGACQVVVANAYGAVTSAVATLTVIVPSGVVGYFTDHDPAATGLELPIRLAGYTPRHVTDIAGEDLVSLRLLVLNEFHNSAVSPALLGRLPDIQSWVSQGGKLVIHDRSAGNLWPNPFLPGPAATNTQRCMTDDLDVLRPDHTLVTAGPFGAIDDRTLDGGSFSAHGWVPAEDLPPGARPILCVGKNSNQVAAFSWPLGRGVIYYSTIPLDCYLAGGDCAHSPLCAVLQTNYLPNVLVHVDFIAPSLPPLRLQPPQPSGDGAWHLWLGQADGSPITPDRAVRIRLRATTNLALPFDQWAPVMEPLVLTNGLLRLDGLNPTDPPQRFFRAVENP